MARHFLQILRRGLLRPYYEIYLNKELVFLLSYEQTGTLALRQIQEEVSRSACFIRFKKSNEKVEIKFKK